MKPSNAARRSLSSFLAFAQTRNRFAFLVPLSLGDTGLLELEIHVQNPRCCRRTTNSLPVEGERTIQYYW